MMDAPFAPVPDRTALAQLFAESHTAPVVLFQHDPFCGISARAHRELAQLSGPVHRVDVARQQDLTRDITTRTGVRHASPQVLVLRNGRAVWSAAHGAITTAAVRRALDASPAAAATPAPQAAAEPG